MKIFSPNYFRSFVFGVEDSLVSTVGLLSGVAAAGTDHATIILTGLILILVEAFSMGVGSLLSDNSTAEYRERLEVPLKRSFGPGLVMFVSYLISGFIPLLPYLFWPAATALPWSIIFSLGALFALGASSARLSGIPVLRHSFLVMLIGGVAIALGVTAGLLLGGE